MRIGQLFVRTLAALAIAFVLASAVMFWVPFFSRHSGWITTGYADLWTPSYDIVDTYTETLKTLSPQEERHLLDGIVAELEQQSTSGLYKIRAYDDPCGNDVIDCRGLVSAKVKPFIDAILTDRQVGEAAVRSYAANVISAASLFVSFSALMFAGLTYFKRRHSE